MICHPEQSLPEARRAEALSEVEGATEPAAPAAGEERGSASRGTSGLFVVSVEERGFSPAYVASHVLSSRASPNAPPHRGGESEGEAKDLGVEPDASEGHGFSRAEKAAEGMGFNP